MKNLAGTAKRKNPMHLVEKGSNERCKEEEFLRNSTISIQFRIYLRLSKV
jgi:hypothetical protein